MDRIDLVFAGYGVDFADVDAVMAPHPLLLLLAPPAVVVAGVVALCNAHLALVNFGHGNAAHKLPDRDVRELGVGADTAGDLGEGLALAADHH